MKRFYPFKLLVLLLLFSVSLLPLVNDVKAQTPGLYNFQGYTAGTEMVIGTMAGSFSWDIPLFPGSPTPSGLTAVVVGTGHNTSDKIRVIVNVASSINYLAFNRNGAVASVTKGIIKSTNGNAFKLNSIDLIPVNTAAHNLSIRAMKNGLQVGSVVTRYFPPAIPIVYQNINLESNVDFANIDAFEVFSDVPDLGVRVNNIHISAVQAVAPTLTTTLPTSVTTASAFLGGNVTNAGGGTVTERGIVYSSTNSNPVIDGTGVTKVSNGSGIGTFSSLLSGLTRGTTYYVKAYAISGGVTGYGSVESFTTKINLTSLNRQNAALSNSSVVYYDVIFPVSVTGLSSNNFSVTATSLPGVSIANVTGSGTNWSVGINTGNANQSGTLRLDLVNTAGVHPQIENVPFTGQAYTIDKIAPSVTLSSTDGASGSTISANSIVVTAQFSEAVGTLTANKVIPVNASVTEFVSVSSTSYRFKVTPSAPGVVTVTVPASSVQDDAGNDNTSGTFSFTYTPPLNQAPIVSTSWGNTVYLGNAVTVDAGITVSDADDATLASAKVSITSGFVNGEDVLNFVYQNGITGVYNHATGILTLTGSATLPDYQAALRSITYSNNILTPTTGNRTITFELNDGTINGNTANKLLKVLGLPTITTSTPTGVTNTAATLGGNITSAGGGTITARGIVFSTTNTDPQIGGTDVSQISAAFGEGAFSSNINFLTVGTVYYVNTYATNEVGTTYGTVLTFATYPDYPTITVPSNPCVGTTMELSALAVVGATYKWSGPNNFISSDRVAIINNVTEDYTGNYTFEITVNGMSRSQQAYIVIKPIPPTPTASNNGPLLIGNTLNLSTPTVAGAVYHWTGPNGFSSFVQNPSLSNVTALNVGNYSVTVTVAGCTSSAGTTNVSLQTLSSIDVSPVGTASSLSTVYGISSSANSYTVVGNGLTSTILVETPEGFEVSNDGTTYSNSVRLSQAGGVIFVRLNAASYTGTYSGNLITSSGGTTTSVPLPASTVARATLTLTAHPVNKTYGGVLTGESGFTEFLSSAGLANGETVGSVTVAYGTGAAANAAVGTYAGSVTISGATGGTFMASNYAISYVAGDIMVGAKALTVTANSVNKTYGQLLTDQTGATAFISSGLENGETIGSVTLSYGPGAAATASAGTYTGSVTPSEAVGGTFIPSNYTIAYRSGDLIVGGKTLSITAHSVRKTYGNALTQGASTSFTTVGLEEGETIESVTMNYGNGAAISSGIGTYSGQVVPVAAVGRNFNASNYVITYHSADIIVEPKLLIVTAGGIDKVYDGNTEARVQLSDNRVPGDDLNVTYAAATFITPEVGTNKLVNVTGIALSGGTSSGNYLFSMSAASATAAITPKAITVMVAPQNKVYGEADPAFTYTYSGSLIGTDRFSGELARAAGENVNDYAIHLGTLTLGSNYSIVYEGANLTISKAVLTITANNAGMCQGSELPLFTFSYSGFKFADNESSLSTRPVVSTTANRNSPVGNYVLVPAGAVSANYTFVYANGQLSIQAAPVVTIASDSGPAVSKGATVKLTAAGGVSYSWANANGIIDGQNTAVLTVRPSQNTTYTVTATNANGCSQTASITILVEDDMQLVAGTNILTPNGDGKNDFLVIKNIDMYPNNEIRIFDIAGRLIYKKKGYDNSWAGTLNGSPLSKGTYYYIIDFGDGRGMKKGFVSIVRD